ncbi:MAG: cysteine desulfurase family protein [Candidatus Nanopelagicales bacterium]|nr:cysteine desulfurase family protein [Candidatus Nanopelagicales bacterium]
MIYLDHNATTPVLPEVLNAMLPYLKSDFGNPSSSHPLGQRARAGVEKAREQVAALLSCEPDEVFFTSGGTESNNIAILGAAALADQSRHRVVTSTVEHPATVQPCARLGADGWRITRLPVGATGSVDAAGFDATCDASVALVTLMLAQNETGALMPVRQVAESAHRCGALSHTDAAQAIGKIAVGVDDLGVDLLSIAGHKVYAPKGVGALYVRSGTPIRPVLVGAGQERGLRPGTENVASVVGLGAACELAAASQPTERPRLTELRETLWERLSAAVPGLVRHGDRENCLPNTLNVSFPNVSGNAVLDATPDVAASTGSACHSGGEDPSPTLTAMGVDRDVALGAVRLSLGKSTTSADITRAADALAAGFAAAASQP